MCLQMCRIDHQLIRLARFGCEACKYLVEHTHRAPSDKPVVDRLGRAILRWSVAPAQPIADYENNTADDPTVIDARNPLRQREIRLNLAHLRLGQPNQVTPGNASFAAPLNQPLKTYASTLIGPEPRSSPSFRCQFHCCSETISEKLNDPDSLLLRTRSG